MIRWPLTELGELFRIKHGYAFKGQHFSEQGKYLVLTPGNFNESGGFRPRPGKDRYYQGKFPDSYILNKGDLIVAMTEQGEGLLGSPAIIPESKKFLHNQRLGLIQTKKGVSDAGFLFHLFKTEYVRKQIRNTSSGAKVRHTSPERIYRVKARIPEYGEQRKIAAVLAAYDDLIENNKRRIAILEKMAEEIYREWFVRMRFPGHENTKFKKGLPVDWSVMELKELVRESSKSAKPGAHLEGRNYLPLDLLESKRMIPSDHLDYTEAQSSLVTFQKNDILFGAMRPYQHKVALAPFNGITRTTCFVVRPKEDYAFSYAFLTLFQPTSIEYANLICNGSDRPYVVWNRGMERMKVFRPDDSTLDRFETSVRPMLDFIREQYFVLRNLRQTRDLLLPRLISGKLSVEDLDIQFPTSMTEEKLSEQEATHA